MTAIQTPQAPPLETTAFDELGGSFRGELLLPTSPGYDTARRIWNGAIDRHPACIARCTGVADVVAAVRFARERDLLVAVRSGGHGVGGHALCDGGLVIDLSPMKGIRVDPQARTARAEAGVLWGELDRETQLFGLATVGGIVSHTGVAGLTLGGGIGWLMRKYGATVDNLLSVDLVTADGELVTASENENPDLFWGVRGGGGNFGIVTSFEYRLHPVGPIVLAGPIFHPLEDASARRGDRLADAKVRRRRSTTSLSADVVTAEGRARHARARTRTPICSGALRGGGGNFGIVTSFEYRLHPVGPIVARRPDLLRRSKTRRRSCASIASSPLPRPTS